MKDGNIGRRRFLFAAVIALVLAFPLTAAAWENGRKKPVPNHGRKWRIGYYEAGPWRDYQNNLIVTVKGLMKLGWIAGESIPPLPDRDDTSALWDWLGGDSRSRYLDFVKTAYWSSGWNEEVRKKKREDCIERLRNRELDLILALGTCAGQDLVNDRHAVPTVVMSTTDPIRSGIIKSHKDSGYDHVLVRCDPTRFIRQIRLFHDIIRFKNLGVVYEDTPDGRSYANLGDLRKVAGERGFAIVECIAQDKNLTLNETVSAYTACCRRLAPRIDAFYFTDHRGVHTSRLMEPLEELFRYKVPTWSNRGDVLVRHGVLMSVARRNLDHLGVFYAKTLARILNGAKPRQLNQVCREPFSLAVNVETARRIGYNVPRNVLKVANVLYDKIEIHTSK
jgi:ABC-type uncharacterized transport system substrate-binding protein